MNCQFITTWSLEDEQRVIWTISFYTHNLHSHSPQNIHTTTQNTPEPNKQAKTHTYTQPNTHSLTATLHTHTSHPHKPRNNHEITQYIPKLDEQTKTHTLLQPNTITQSQIPTRIHTSTHIHSNTKTETFTPTLSIDILSLTCSPTTPLLHPHTSTHFHTKNKHDRPTTSHTPLTTTPTAHPHGQTLTHINTHRCSRLCLSPPSLFSSISSPLIFI